MGVKVYNSGSWIEIGYNATKLAIPVNINGVSFDGSSDITIADSTKLPLAGGTLTGSLTTTSIINKTGIEPYEALGAYVGSSAKPYDSMYGNELYLLSAASTNKIILTASDAVPNIRPATNNTGTLGTSSVYWNNVYSTTFTGALAGNSSTATLASTTTTTEDTSNELLLVGVTSGATTALKRDTNVTVASGTIKASTYKFGTSAYMQYNSTTECIDFIFN